jgi:hypothetical protein
MPPVTHGPAAAVATLHRPEFFPLPGRTGFDPWFHLSRSYYYKLERRGALRLLRMRQPGSIRGKVLVPYDQVSALLHGSIAAPQR